MTIVNNIIIFFYDPAFINSFLSCCLQVIARDVWTHGRIVRSVVRLCERLTPAEEEADEEGDGDESSCSSPPPSTEASCITPVLPKGRRSSAAHERPSKAAQFAKRLERRWELLYLACLERQILLDGQKDQPFKHQVGFLKISSIRLGLLERIL